MTAAVDIEKVITRSTSQVSLEDLTRKGLKQVRVLNHATIARLIAEAVDQTMATRESEISATERQKVVDQAHKQFEQLARDRLKKERSRIDELESANGTLKAEVETLRSRLKASMEFQADRDQARERVRQLEEQMSTMGDSLAEKLLASVTDRLGDVGSTSAMKEIQDSLAGLKRNLRNIAAAGGKVSPLDDLDDTALVELAQRAGEVEMESNVSEVKVKQAKSRGVGDSLAKLRKMQKGVKDDGE